MVGNRTSWTRTLIAAFAFTSLASACGGGGDGGGGNSPPPVGPGDTEKFFPDTIGDTWFYDTTTGDPAEPNMHQHGFGQMEVTGTKSFGSVVAKVFSSSTDDTDAVLETYYRKDGNGLTNHGNNDPADTLTHAIAPYLEGKFPVATGVITTVNRTNVDYGADLDGDRRNEKVDLTLRITMDGFEAQTVPAGTFARTAKRTSTIDGTIHTTGAGDFPFTAQEQLWSAPGVGVVKQLTQVSAGGMAEQQSYVARGYRVDGVEHGMGVPGTFVPDLLVDDSTAPVVASDGSSGFMLATVRKTGTSPIASKVVAEFGDAESTFVREVDVTPSTVGYMMGRAIDVAFDGTNYLLLYSNGTSNTTPNPLLGTRIARSGSVLDVPSGAIEIDEGSVWMAAVTFGSSHYLVVFSRYDDTTGRHLLYGRLVTPAGNVVGATEFPIGPRDQNELYPDVAFDGTNFLVVWQQQPLNGSSAPDITIAAARVSEAGVVLDPNGFVVSNTGKGSYDPHVAFGGGRYLVTWSDGRNAASYMDGGDIYGARVDVGGVPLDGSVTSGGIRISGGIVPQTGYSQVVYTGSEFLVAWSAGAYTGITEQSGIFGARVANDGAVNRGGTSYGIALSGEPSAVSPSTYKYAIPIRLGSRIVVTWAANREIKDVIVYSLE